MYAYNNICWGESKRHEKNISNRIKLKRNSFDGVGCLVGKAAWCWMLPRRWWWWWCYHEVENDIVKYIKFYVWMQYIDHDIDWYLVSYDRPNLDNKIEINLRLRGKYINFIGDFVVIYVSANLL